MAADLNPAWPLAAGYLVLLVLAFRRRNVLHPAVLWLAPWTAAVTLFALHLLPYRALGATAALLLALATLSFLLGLWLGARAEDRLPPRLTGPPPRRLPQETLAAAATLAGVALALSLLVFLGHVASRFGVRAALVSNPDVRRAIGAGEFALTIKYVYLAFACAPLAGLAAATRPGGLRSRALWFAGGVGGACVAAYFSTGRANVVLVAAAGAITYAAARRETLSGRTLVAGAMAVAVFGLAVFTVGGSIIGKTLEAGPLNAVPSPLTDVRALRPLALPYQYVSAPIAAFDLQVEVADPTGTTWGCATFGFACQILSAAGAPVAAVPAIRPFTADPLPWNTYTALDLPLLDWGIPGVPVFFLLTGLVYGTLWRRLCEGGSLATLIYGILAVPLVYSPLQNSFAAPHVVGAVLLATASLTLARFGRRLLAGRVVARSAG